MLSLALFFLAQAAAPASWILTWWPVLTTLGGLLAMLIALLINLKAVLPLSQKIETEKSARLLEMETERGRRQLSIQKLETDLLAVRTEILSVTRLQAQSLESFQQALRQHAAALEGIGKAELVAAEERGRQAERIHSAFNYIDRVAMRAGVSDLQVEAEQRKHEREGGG